MEQNKRKFLDFVADIMSAEISDISLETKYKEYEKWDSLMMMNIVMEVEAEYGISIPLETVEKIRTLKDLFDLTK